MRYHQLKINENYLANLLLGRKKVEIRFNDRDYQVGDVLEISVEPAAPINHFKITHIHSGLGMLPDYVALSVEHLANGCGDHDHSVTVG